MSVIKYIGRKTNFSGHTLWEIVGSLRDYGIGRLVIRNMFQRYPEPCYFRIMDVEILPDSKDTHKVRVTAEKTWRGITLAKPVVIFRTSYKADYSLVPIEEEAKFTTKHNKITEKVLANTVELPPLLREFVSQETGVPDPKINVLIKNSHNKFSRLAESNETTLTCGMTMGLGSPLPSSRKLYDNVQV